jgi:outer membrane receptor protein involved in Fe transport
MKRTPNHTRRLTLSAAVLTIAGAAAPSVLAQEQPVSASAAPAAPDDEVIVLSPFEVNASNDLGYHAATTLSGTRLNSSSRTWPPPSPSHQAAAPRHRLEQHQRRLPLRAQHRGHLSFTDYTLDRGTVTDKRLEQSQWCQPQRGLTSANVALDGFGSSVPIDTYNVDSVEISRGPNSNIFGLGNAGGSVNFIKSKANANQRKASTKLSVDSYGGYRGSFDVNQPLLQEKAGLRVLGLYDDKGLRSGIPRRHHPRLRHRAVPADRSRTRHHAGFEIRDRNNNNRPIPSRRAT